MMIMVMKEGIMVMIFFGYDEPSNNATDYVDGDEEKRGIPGTFENDGWLRLNRTRAPEFLRLHCPRRNFTLVLALLYILFYVYLHCPRRNFTLACTALHIILRLLALPSEVFYSCLHCLMRVCTAFRVFL